MRSLSDAEAVRLLRRDPEAITALYDRHFGRLVAALAAVSGDRELAFDLAQETFARLLEHGHRVRLATDHTAWPWLWTVGRNLLRDQQRRNATDATARRRLGVAVVPFDEDAVDELIRRVDAEQLRAELGAALDELPANQRDAVVARVVEEADYSVLAGEARTGEPALRARVSRGLRALGIRLSGGRP